MFHMNTAQNYWDILKRQPRSSDVLRVADTVEDTRVWPVYDPQGRLSLEVSSDCIVSDTLD